jgi:predicted phage tail protein
MIQGIGREEASVMVSAMFRERVKTIRANGIGKILTGIFVAVGAAATFLILFRIGFISIWLLGSAAIACVSGLWMILTGLLKVLAPKSERGDAADND